MGRPHTLKLHQTIISMPCPVIEISELTQAIADYCLLDDKRSLVSLACSCRALEEQALSTLWSEQSSLATLIKSTLPPGIFPPSEPLLQPTNAEWDRFRRYAAWMRRLLLTRWDPGVPEEVFRLMSLGSTDGVVCPGLRELRWEAYPGTISFRQLFLSTKLTTFALTDFDSFPEPPERGFSILRPVIAGLDTFPLQHLYLRWAIGGETSRQMEPIVSSAVLRCGSALKTLAVFSPVSDAAVQHIMQLPNLTTWYAANSPPRTLNLPLSDVFPQLDNLELVKEVSFGWLSFFTRTARHIPSGQDSNSSFNHGPIQRIARLGVFTTAIDAAFMSPIMLFHELVFLRLSSACSVTRGCAFNLTDNNIAEIATALPRLREASFGTVCFANSCQTTAASLVSLSAHCRDLEVLQIHFNTANIRDDLEAVSADPRLDNLPSLRTCKVFRLVLSNAPYTIGKDDVVPVLRGFRRIFPSLTHITGECSSWGWGKLDRRLPEASPAC